MCIPVCVSNSGESDGSKISLGDIAVADPDLLVCLIMGERGGGGRKERGRKKKGNQYFDETLYILSPMEVSGDG